VFFEKIYTPGFFRGVYLWRPRPQNGIWSGRVQVISYGIGVDGILSTIVEDGRQDTILEIRVNVVAKSRRSRFPS
jgi:hypothetical protein